MDIKQLNWWCPPEEYADIQDEWFIHFFKCGLSQFIFDDEHHATINIYTIFGSGECPNHSVHNVVNLLFVGENQPGIMNTNHPVYPHFDAILTFFYDTPKSIRLPLWMIYWNFYKDGLFECAKDTSSREDRAIIIVSHDNTGLRSQYCEKVSNTFKIPVDSTLSSIPHCKHIVPQKGRLFKNKLIRKYKYNICPENSIGHGYITEKIFEAFANGCIPIYWGLNNPEPSIIQPNSFIHIHDPDIQKTYAKDFWTSDAIIYIFATYLKIWSIVYHKLKLRDKNLGKHVDIVYYNCVNQDDCCTQLKHHWLQYKKLWSPRPIFKINNQLQDTQMEDVADSMYLKYKTHIKD